MNEYNVQGNVMKPMQPASTQKKNNMQNMTTLPMSPTPSTRTPMQQQGQMQPEMFRSDMPQSIFQPAMQQSQPMMQQPASMPRTSIRTSGLGARDTVLTSTDFTQGFLQTQIGRPVKVEFLIGTNMLVDREGELVKVGTDYIILQETETDDYLLCDIYSIKFIRFYY